MLGSTKVFGRQLCLVTTERVHGPNHIAALQGGTGKQNVNSMAWLSLDALDTAL